MNKRMIFSVLILGIFLVLGGVFWGFRGRQPLRTGEVRIGEKVFKVEVAEDMMSRSQGLSGRESLGEGEGMLFIFDSPENYGFWTKGMKFPIDIVWIRGDKIVGFTENVEPEPPSLRRGFGGQGTSVFSLTTYYPPEAVDKVLEVNAGTVGRNSFKVGDVVKVSF